MEESHHSEVEPCVYINISGAGVQVPHNIPQHEYEHLQCTQREGVPIYPESIDPVL